MKNVLIVTGGSGGHVIPSITLFEHLKYKFAVKLVSDFRGSKFIDKSKYEFEIIDIPNIYSKLYLVPINFFKYINSFFKSIIFIKKNKINVLISTGGYMTFPFCLAAFILKKKIILLEPNSVLGVSNKIALYFSSKIICYDKNLKNFPKKFNFKKIIMKPILKKEIYNVNKNYVDNSKNSKKILVIGGSQGASFFDHKITELIINISKKQKIEVIQQISNFKSVSIVEQKYRKANINFKFFEFTNDVDKIFSNVNLAITRGGASTLTELSFLKIPFIAIPLPSAKDNHQFYNSNYYYQKNCCWILNQNDFEINEFSNLLLGILNNGEEYDQKLQNLDKISKKNTWNNTNNHIIEIINEN